MDFNEKKQNWNHIFFFDLFSYSLLNSIELWSKHINTQINNKTLRDIREKEC
jgi:hypothetical protein